MSVPLPVGASALTDADERTREMLRRLELDVVRRLDGLLQGDFRGLVPGLGSEPGETREYAPGDDVRRMDWNVTARTAVPHIRNSIADRELETTLLVDLSRSLDVGTRQHTKRELAINAAGAVGLLTDRVGNRIGAVVVDGSAVHDLKAGTGRRHLLALLHQIATFESTAGGTDLVAGLHRMGAPSRRRGLAVIVSDLLATGWADALHRVTTRHETLVIEVVDPLELELPSVGVIEMVDAETGAFREVDTRKASTRQAYAEAARQRLANHAAMVRSSGADHLLLRTDGDWVVDLARFVDRRRRGMRATRRQPVGGQR